MSTAEKRHLKQFTGAYSRSLQTYLYYTLVLSAILLVLLALVIVGEASIVGDRSAHLTRYFVLGLLVLNIVAVLVALYLVRSQNTQKLEEDLRWQQLADQQVQRLDQMRVAAEIAREASIGTNLDNILQHATQRLYEEFGYYHVAIYLIEAQVGGSFAEMKATAGGSGSQTMLANQHALPVGSGSMIGYVAHKGQTRVALDIMEEVYHLPNHLLPATKSELTVPLRVEERVLGVLDIQSAKTASFTQSDILIVQTLADLLAVAIDKTALHQQIRTYTQDLERVVEERTQELAQERAQLSAILNAMTEGVIYEENATTRYINQAFSDILGYDETSWDGMLPALHTADSSLGEVKAQYDAMSRALDEKGIWENEVNLRCAKGEALAAHLTVMRVPQTGQMTHGGTVTIVRDIRQEKALREQRRRFIAYASHELRTPLANLKMRLYLLRQKPQDLAANADIMQRIMNRMQRLVDDLLEISRLERGVITLQRDILPLQVLVRRVLMEFEQAAQQKDISIQIDLADDIVHVNIDQDRIAQVLTNLLSNALNYTPEGGRVSLSLSRRDASTVAIVISDTGVGIPEDKVEAIFQPFVRVNNHDAPGTGLGLNITQQLVDLHDGEIIVESQVGQGSTFTFTLPIVAEPISQVQDRANKQR